MKNLRNPSLVKIYFIPLIFMLLENMSAAISVLYILELGGDVFEVNLILTIRSTMGILFIVPFGILSDRLGRKPMVLYPSIIRLLGIAVYAFATNTNQLIIASIVFGFLGGGFFPTLLSIIGDITKPEDRQGAVNMFYFFSSLGMLIGPTISSFLLTFSQITLRNIYQIQFIGEAIFCIYLFTQVKETIPKKTEKQESEYRSALIDLFSQTNFQSLILMALLFFFYNSIIQTYIPIYACVDLNLSNVEVTSLSTFRGLAVLVIRLIGATLLARVSMKPFLIIALTIGGITSLFTPLANSYLLLVLSIFLSGLSYGAVMSLGSTLVSLSSNLENRGVANSVYMASIGVARIIMLVTTPIAETFGNAAVFLLGGACALAAVMPTLFYKLNVSARARELPDKLRGTRT